MKQIYILSLVIFLFSACKKDNGGQAVYVSPKDAVTITDFTPKSAQPGAKITITGTGFGSDASAVAVAVNSTPYFTLVSVSPTTIVIQTNLGTPSGKIRVTVNGNAAVSTTDFTALLEDLRIVGFDDQVQLGHQFNMYADGFGTDTNKISMSFGGTTPVKANYIGPSSSVVGAMVPRYAQGGKVTLTLNGKSVISDKILTLAMSMRDFSPKTIKTGDTVKITGVQFTNQDEMWASFNNLLDKQEKPIKVTPTEMWFIVPSYAKSGYLEIGQRFGLTDISDTKFTFIPK
ncbi:IPT/TIG domain-containing protein [Mucilaginibacter polytrichastri]|uniref:IPT/TIG domain-containing protein n=1 Tax=Mucilaginibacter polytrichastri TaxID=1302689 RepID=A0A1Q6A2F2_9SPHI|nr:IPT/TIG domain-containing protein [Mucilaginibacter polytrichastri]OKS88197.1 hypothetical protein RG47T_3661 [Mucilaginibacter polytrichastri]SFT08499.1 IPT/TIG domain-containing protein [Mucilaginibacter polytrichastri]